jgi:cell division protease FtsH
VQALLKDSDPLHKVSIIPRGPMGGATFSLPERDRMVYPKAYLMSMLKVTFGGRIAEEVFCNDISSGASQDIRQATDIVKRMVVEWGMDEKVGFVFYGEHDGRPGVFDMPGQRDYSDKTAELIDQEVKAIVDRAYKETRELILANRQKLEDIAQNLLKYETLDGEEVHAIIRGERVDKPSINDILDADHMAPPLTPPAKSKSEPDSELPGLGAMPQPG